MKSKIVLLGAATLLMSAWAQADGHGNEATIRLMALAEGDLPEAVTNEIVLPDAVPDNAVAADKMANRLAGLATAIENLARRDDGIAQARDALSNALENQETRGRSSENIPESRPEPAGPP